MHSGERGRAREQECIGRELGGRNQGKIYAREEL